MIQLLNLVPAPADIVNAVAELYERGLYLQAYEVALQRAELREWTGVVARTLAGRLAANLGASPPGTLASLASLARRAVRRRRPHRKHLRNGAAPPQSIDVPASLRLARDDTMHNAVSHLPLP